MLKIRGIVGNTSLDTSPFFESTKKCYKSATSIDRGFRIYKFHEIHWRDFDHRVVGGIAILEVSFGKYFDTPCMYK